jgi:multidrug efflux pump subunit AcrB
MLTMVGLLLAIGLLMDDGIVIAENIAAQRERGKGALEAAIQGTREVAGGVLSSFATTILVLGPLATLAGDLGKILKVVPMILILVMTVSLVEAFWILPRHLSHSLHDPEKQRARLRRRITAGMDYVRERLLGGAIERLLPWRYLWLGTVLLLLLLAVSLIVGGVVRFQAFPELEGDTIVARILMPPGTPLERTEAVVDRVTGALEPVSEQYADDMEGGDLVRTVYTQHSLNRDAFDAGAHVATVFVDLLAAENRHVRLDAILQSWCQEVGDVPDAISLSYTEPAMGPAGRSIKIRFRGEDLPKLRDAARATKEHLSQYVGVYNLAVDLRQGKPELRLRLREGALGLGLDARMIAGQLRAAFQGEIATEMQIGSEDYEVDVQFRPDSQDSLADLDEFRVSLPSGEKVPLDAVVEIDAGAGWTRIFRVDNQRTVTLRGDVDPAKTNTVAILDNVEQEFLPELLGDGSGIEYEFEGEIKESGETRASMLRALGVGLLGVFVLLSFQFRSFVEPLIVMISIPLALIGVVAGHLIMGIDLSLPSLLGYFSLAGIVVNDSILLVLFIKQERREDQDVQSAVAEASRRRFRAITITSLTTIAGLLPILFERSLQAQILIPLIVSVVFGLLATVVLVLLVTPCLYVILDDLGWTASVGES